MHAGIRCKLRSIRHDQHYSVIRRLGVCSVHANIGNPGWLPSSSELFPRSKSDVLGGCRRRDGCSPKTFTRGCLSIFAGRILIFLKQRVERARRQRRLAGSRSRCPPERSPGFGGSPATAGVLAVRQDPCKDPNLLEPPSVLSNWVSRKNTERSFRIQHWLASPINATPRPET